jgi:DNA-binding response OmpR family regulator
MRILIADDDPVTCCRLEDALMRWGYQVETVFDGLSACQHLQSADGASLAILDWMMPGMNGLEVCGRVKMARAESPPHVILLTARQAKQDRIAGLEGGADDYMTKPFDDDELLARLHVGERMLGLQGDLAHQVAELRKSLAQIKKLQGLLPICSYCKKIRTDQNYWEQVEAYITSHSEAEFSHTICPTCFQEKVRPEMEQFLARGPSP